MKKAFDQTVRDLKRGVNKKVLKVPGIEQKVLDATSNEPWGPHGSILADIAQATRNYHEYQMIMTIIWKRINDTGKNWRHVYKGLTVLEYLVANGSERVIDEIREHAYQISTLSDFQYIDSSGRDQGNNVRKKSLSLVALVNDKERIAEVRQKAAANRDKFRSASSGGMYRPGPNSSGGGYGDRYDDDRYGSRDGDRNGYGREREGGYRDDDRYGRYGDSHSRDGDRYGRDYEDRYSRDGYRDDDSRGRTDDYQSGSRSRSSEGQQGRSYDDDGQYSSRDSGAKADDVSQNGQDLELRNSDQNSAAPPSYEEAINEAQSPVYSERNGEKAAAPAHRESSPTTSYSPTITNAPFSAMALDGSGHGTTSKNQGDKVFDEFDPRGSVSAPAAAVTPANPVTQSSSNAEMDLLGSLSDSFALALVPTTPATSETSANAENFGMASSASNNVNQPLEDPFGDGPFRAVPSSETVAPLQTSTSSETFQPNVNEKIQSNKPGVPNFGFGDSFSVTTYSAPGVFDAQLPANLHSASQASSNLSQEVDILADILPPSQSPVASQSLFTGSTGQAPAAPFSAPSGYQQSFSSPSVQQSEQPFSAPIGHAAHQTYSASVGEQTEQPLTLAHTGQSPQASGGIYGSFNSQLGSLPTAGLTTAPHAQAGYSGQISGVSFLPQVSAHAPSYMGNQPLAGPNAQSPSYFMQQGGSTVQSPSPPHMAFQSPNGPPARYNSGSFTPQQGIGSAAGSIVSQSAPSTPPLGRQSSGNVGSMLGQTGGSSLNVPQPSKDKFETKSTVWTDTLSRGLVDLNISGPKTNPLSDIGVDFEAINRKEKRMEKPSTAPVVSTVNMGKAMGAGSGIGRASAGAMRAPPNLMIGSGMGMGVAGNPAMGMGSYGGVNPSMGLGMGMGMNRGMGMAQGAPMQPPSGFPSGANISGAYNPMMGRGGYGAQQPPYGGYR